MKAWALEKDVDPAAVHSNTFLLEWPPKSGKEIEVPEIDKAEWFDLVEAKKRSIRDSCHYWMNYQLKFHDTDCLNKLG